MLFIPSDSRMNRAKVDIQRVHAEMAEALGAQLHQVPVPLVVIAPSGIFEQVWQALVHGTWSENLKTNFTCLRSDGEVQFIRKT